MATKKHLVMVIDLDRCIGCWTCAVACKTENNVQVGSWWNRVLTPESTAAFAQPGKGPDGKPIMTFMPLACQHCENAPCVHACPTGATFKREDGITGQDYSKCVGCRTCMSACPYNVRVFNWREPAQLEGLEGDHLGSAAVPQRIKGIVEKCTFCQERIDRGELPACVEACPVQTRTFGDLNDPNSDVSRLIRERGGYQLKPEFGTNPSVYYLPPRRKRTSLTSEGGNNTGGTV